MTRLRRGMTLLELVVALAVGGMALAAGGAAFATVADQRARALREADVDRRALAARRAIADWIGDVQLSADGDAPGFRGIDGTRRANTTELPDDEVSFLTTAATPRGDDPSRVHFFIARAADSTSGALVAELSDRRGRDLVRVTLAEGVAGFNVRYFTQAFGRAEWLDSWASATLLPGAVEVTLFAAPGDSLRGPLQWPITVPLANGR
ncbi:MAG: prepilin-type N-terminal cleavage/methylation domain-containing protein [Gemmatimonadetes bacterium]|nr:prepilin-type N-terminal cleavage/methylation domain-containing protein [Gemmatimonadota bacterium]